MFITNPLVRFVRHGSDFLWRVGAIFAGVVAAGTWEACKAVALEDSEELTLAPRIVSEQDAWSALQKGQISPSEFGVYQDLFHD